MFMMYFVYNFLTIVFLPIFGHLQCNIIKRIQRYNCGKLCPCRSRTINNKNLYLLWSGDDTTIKIF